MSFFRQASCYNSSRVWLKCIKKPLPTKIKLKVFTKISIIDPLKEELSEKRFKKSAFGMFRLSTFITSLRDRCSNWNKSRNSVYNPTSQEVKQGNYFHKKTGLTNLCIVNRGGRCFIWYKNHIKQNLHFVGYLHQWYNSRGFYFNCFLIVFC